MSPLRSTMNEVRSLYESHEERICGIEATLDQSEQRLVQVEAKLNTVRTENAWLKEKVDDLENLSQLKSRGLSRVGGGVQPSCFYDKFFRRSMWKRFFPEPLLLARGASQVRGKR